MVKKPQSANEVLISYLTQKPNCKAVELIDMMSKDGWVLDREDVSFVPYEYVTIHIERTTIVREVIYITYADIWGRCNGGNLDFMLANMNTILHSEYHVYKIQKHEYYEIGSREEIIGGILFTPAQTDNGYCYKSEKAIKEHKGICYISESAFSDENIQYDNDRILLTTDNVHECIENGGVVTWDSALEDVKKRIDNYGFICFSYKRILKSRELWNLYHQFAEHITECALGEIEWQGLDVYLDDFDFEENLDYFLRQKFIEYAKERIKKDGDDTDIEDSVFEKNLFGFLGETCYRNKKFELTDWDSLIDKWEDEPCI